MTWFSARLSDGGATEVDADLVRAAAAATIAGECRAKLLKLVLSDGTSFLSCSAALGVSRAANCDRMYCSNGRSGSKLLGLSGCSSSDRPAAATSTGEWLVVAIVFASCVRTFKRDLFDVQRVNG